LDVELTGLITPGLPGLCEILLVTPQLVVRIGRTDVLGELCRERRSLIQPGCELPIGMWLVWRARVGPRWLVF
jgi:hypothetical protein